MTAIIDGTTVVYDLMASSPDAYPNLDLKYLGYGRTKFSITGHFFLRNEPSLDVNFPTMGDGSYPEIKPVGLSSEPQLDCSIQSSWNGSNDKVKWQWIKTKP